MITKKITEDEWKELNNLRQAISECPSSVIPEKMERFTQLFVRSISGCNDDHPSLR